jgi:hypothetical protein
MQPVHVYSLKFVGAQLKLSFPLGQLGCNRQVLTPQKGLNA